MKNRIKKILQSIFKSHQVIGLEYPLELKSNYNFESPHAELNKIIEKNRNGYIELINHSLQFKNYFNQISFDKVDEMQPFWNNHFFPGLDIVLLYSILDVYQPKQYLEIGCGTSTKVTRLYRTNHAKDFSITCIDPSPRQEILNVADQWINQPIQKTDLAIIKNLSANDILFFDGTHVLYPNSDVMWFFWEILPIIPKGVIVQVHDIYLPYDYPEFMIQRYYNENYILGSVVMANPDKYEIISPNFYISEQKDLAQILNSVWQMPSLNKVEQHGGSFWFKIK